MPISTPVSPEEVTAFEDAQTALAQLTGAATPQGGSLLRAEVSVLRRIQSTLNRLREEWRTNAPDAYTRAVRELLSKKATLASIATEIVSEGVDIERFQLFLKSSQGVFTLPGADGDRCPFCRRPLDATALELTKKYHAFLVNTLQEEISALTQHINSLAKALEEIRDCELDITQEMSAVLSAKERQELLDCIAKVRSCVPNPLPRTDVPVFGTCDIVPLERWITRLGREAEKREEVITIVSSGNAARQEETERLKTVIQQHLYRQKLAERMDDLKNLCRTCESRQTIHELVTITDFPTILRRMTNAGNQAHTDLILAEFERSLDREYIALSGKTPLAFGMRLKPRGEQQEIAVATHIHDTPIQRVLSEGEQKIHSLAMFFCEPMARPCDVYVFDDPSTSFDYNHLASFVERLRDLAQQFPYPQLIIFTHNWDLFVQSQMVFNKSHLSSDMEVMSIENCSLMKAYSERAEDLKRQIGSLLMLPGDFDSTQKEQISGLMRRLIESVVNRRVFNGQRHQFKQRSQAVSVFDEYVQLVPLTRVEAQKLSDLYAHLSVSEHDDPRNIYVSRNKTSFQQWYNEICIIEGDLVSRRP